MKTIKNLTAEELRKSILQLAIQGKLVKQNPDDEPASELVKRIYEEKAKLVAEGKIKKDKNQSYIFKGDDNCYYEQIGNDKPIKLEDLPFDIPDNWTWIRFPNLVNFVLGKTPERHNNKYWNNGKYPWFSIADMKDKTIIYTSKEKISEQSYHDNFSSKLSPAGTLLMSFKLTVGRVSILGVDAVHNEAIISIFPYYDNDNSIRDWLFYTLGILVDYVEQTDAIKGSTLNKEKMSKMLIPIPSINEQKKIIDKLNSFEPILNYYNELEIELTKMENEFSEKLKKSVLQYAIEGKLVKQDESDEPASVLLERIKAGKDILAKDGKIKREKNDNIIIQNDDKNYYMNIPYNWIKIPLPLAMKKIIAGGDKPKEFSEIKNEKFSIPVIANGLTNNGIIGYTSNEGINELCITISGRGTIGFPIIRNYEFLPIVRLIVLIPLESINIEFLCFYLSSIVSSGNGSCVQQLTIPMIKEKYVLLPPLQQQERIVNKLKNISILID